MHYKLNNDRKMKILYIIPSLRKGGAERLVLDMVSELKRRDGIEVELICFRDENAYQKEYPDIQPKIIKAWVRSSIFHQWKFHITELQNFIENFKPDIIHTHLFEAEFVSRSVNYKQACWFSHGHDNMFQFRNFDLHTLTNKSLFTNYYEKTYLFKRYRLNGGNHFIAISKDTQVYYQKTAKDFIVTFLPNAINYTKFSIAKSRQNAQQNKIYLINIGSYSDKKNQKFLIEIAKILVLQCVDFELNLLGNGQNYEAVTQQIKDYKLEKYVFQRGNVEGVENYLAQSDIYLHSAYYEPFGLVLLEAMAAGLPVITLDGKGNRDIIEQGKNGYMIYRQDAELFANKIIDLWKDKQKYQEMSAYAQEYAKQFDIKLYVDRLVELYKRKSFMCI